MPIACEVSKQYLCMHGGISPALKSIQDIDRVKRFVEPPLNGLLVDLLWSDPLDDKKAKAGNFVNNKSRDCSVSYGLEPVQNIL